MDAEDTSGDTTTEEEEWRKLRDGYTMVRAAVWSLDSLDELSRVDAAMGDDLIRD